MAKAKSATTASKKVGTARVTRKGRTVQIGTAKHTYANVAAAKAAYTRLRSAKAVNGFKAKYGKKAVRKVVRKTTRKTTRKTAPKRRVVRKTTRKTTTKRRVARKNPVKRRRRNAPMSRAESNSVKAILRRHGYIR